MKKTNQRKSKEISNSIISGLSESLSYVRGKSTVYRARVVNIPPVPEFKGNEIKEIRGLIRLTQKLFAQTLGVSVKTVEAWEANRNIPDGPAQRMLFAFKNNPKSLRFFNIKAAFIPPKPQLLRIIADCFNCCAKVLAQPEACASRSFRPTVGGTICSCCTFKVTIVSINPAEPKVCPVPPFIE